MLLIVVTKDQLSHASRVNHEVPQNMFVMCIRAASLRWYSVMNVNVTMVRCYPHYPFHHQVIAILLLSLFFSLSLALFLLLDYYFGINISFIIVVISVFIVSIYFYDNYQRLVGVLISSMVGVCCTKFNLIVLCTIFISATISIYNNNNENNG